MKTAIAALALLLASALPAAAQVVIEEAPGAAGASMEPTFFLNTETARILPANLNVVSLAGGAFPAFYSGNLAYARGMGAGGELRVNAALLKPLMQITPPPPLVYGGGVGYKQRVAIAGPFDVALAAQAAYYTTPGLQVGLPLTAMAGPGDLTLQPRATLPDMATGARTAVYDLQAGYRLPLGSVRLLLEASGGWRQSGQPIFGGRAGLRYALLPNLHFDLQGGVDFDAAGVPAAGGALHLGHPEAGSIVNAAVRFSL